MLHLQKMKKEILKIIDIEDFKKNHEKSAQPLIDENQKDDIILKPGLDRIIEEKSSCVKLKITINVILLG